MLVSLEITSLGVVDSSKLVEELGSKESATLGVSEWVLVGITEGKIIGPTEVWFNASLKILWLALLNDDLNSLNLAYLS